MHDAAAVIPGGQRVGKVVFEAAAEVVPGNQEVVARKECRNRPSPTSVALPSRRQVAVQISPNIVCVDCDASLAIGGQQGSGGGRLFLVNDQ